MRYSYWGARDGAAVRVDALCGLSLLLVLSLAPRGFSPGTPVFPSPQKPTLPNSNSTRNQVDEEPLCGRATSKSLFILFIYWFHATETGISSDWIDDGPVGSNTDLLCNVPNHWHRE